MRDRVGEPEALDIVYLLGCEKWWDWEREGFATRTAQLGRTLARHPRVRRLIAVDVPTSVPRLVTSAVTGSRVARGVGTTADGVIVVDQARLLPRERADQRAYRINGILSDNALRRRVQRLLSERGVSDPVVFLTGPHVAKYAEWFPDAVVVYDGKDEYLADAAQDGMRREIERGYAIIRERADIVFTVSERLAASFHSAAGSVLTVPNGVEPGRFAAVVAEPADIAPIPRPRVGYVGVMQSRVDVGLVAALAQRMPQVSFVLVGPIEDPAHFASLEAVSNVHLIGRRAFEDIPSYIASFDVCFLPHVDNELTRNMDPLKLYEFIAAGKVTVATDLAGIVQPDALVRRAATIEEFASDLGDALAGRWRMDAATQAEYVGLNAWDARVDRMLAEIDRVRDARGRLAASEEVRR